MKIVFVLIGDENLAIEYLSSFIAKRLSSDLVFDQKLFNNGAVKSGFVSKFFDTSKEVLKEVYSKNPDIIGFLRPET